MTKKKSKVENTADDEPKLNAAGPTPPQKPTVAPDPFDNLELLRLAPAFEESAGIRKVISTVPVRKPSPQEWVRVHPDPAYRMNLSCILLKAEKEFYLLMPAIARDFERDAIHVTIYTCINSSGVVLLWPCRIVSEGGRQNAWHSSAHEAAAVAMEERIRFRSNMELGAYEWDTTTSPSLDPVWPDVPFNELLRIGFGKIGHLVDTPQHPLIKQLRGD
jgi:hypothetical protein